MTDDADTMLSDLAEPVQQLVNESIAALPNQQRALVAVALQRGAQLVLMIELNPVFRAQVIIDDGQHAIELAELRHAPPLN